MDCSPLTGKDWLLWTVGSGLIGYGGGMREGIPMGIGGGIVVTDLFGKSDPKNRKCRILKKSLISLASAGIGFLIGNSQYKSDAKKINSSSSGSGGPGPTPPNGLALRF